MIRGVLDALDARGRFMSLDQWIRWGNSYLASGSEGALERAADPRLGEWTALQIVDGLIGLLMDRQPDQRPPIHPANVMVPALWTRLGREAPGGMSWGEWKQLVARRRLKLAARAFIEDDRYMGPEWRTDRSVPAEWPWVRGLGMLLLGMLRRSFTWPASWNPDFAQNARSGLARALVSMVPCSSTTAAIVEATLTSRARESVIRQADLQLEQLDSDTVFDPPRIESLSQLREWIRRATEVLEEHQMSGQQNKPRQLVPLRLRQLTRPVWTDAEVQDGR